MTSHGVERGSVSKRKGSIKACLRCHRRKQRCVGFPSCTNCQAVNIPCHRDSTATVRKLAGLSKEELMKRIEQLEHQVATQPHTRELSPSRQSPTSSFSPRTNALAHLEEEQQEHCTNIETGQRDNSSVCDERRLHNAAEMLQQPLEIPPTQVSAKTPSSTMTPDETESRVASFKTGVDVNEGHIIPSEPLGSQFVNAYFESLHRRLPVCDFSQLLACHRELHRASISPAMSEIEKFRLYMAYAIGAAVLNLTGLSSSSRPDQYLATATIIRNSLENDLVLEIEVLLWTVLYKLRSSFTSEVWYMIGLAMRKAIEGNLHREHYYHNLGPGEGDFRRRLFWAVYVTERNVCWSLKRPFSVADHDIDTALPKLGIRFTTLEDGFQCHTGMTYSTDAQQPLDSRIFVATIRLSRINSQTFTELYRVDRELSLAVDQVPSLLDRLRQFEISLPACSASDYDFLQLHVQNSIRVLIEPFLSSLHSSHNLLRICLEAAGNVCQLFKKMRLKRSLGYSFTMVNSVFVAGTTICYILFKNPGLWTPSRANDIRACSSTLFAAAERNNAVRKYCDVLESIINATMDHVEQVSNSRRPSMTASTCSPLASPENGAESPAVAFKQLKDTLKELKFEFPAQSYPAYRTSSDMSYNDMCEGLMSNAPNTALEHDHSGVNFPSYSIDTAFSDVRWDLMGPFNEAIDITSSGFVFGEDVFT